MDKFEHRVEASPAGDEERLEQDLRHCLQHVSAPEGFTDRVMARVAERDLGRTRRVSRGLSFAGMHRSAGWWSALAAALLLAVGGNVMHERHQEKERAAAQVQAQMDLAMELTGHALDQVQGGIERSSAGRYTQILDELGR